MGAHPGISFEDFPKQGEYLGKRVRVTFHHDVTRHVMGTVVRDDEQEPFRTIIRLDDGRAVMAGECQYSPPRDSDQPNM